VPVTVCVPLGNNPEKNEALRGYGATLIEEGRDYDEAVQVADRLVRDRGMRLVHSTNDRQVLAGAATLSAEILEQAFAEQVRITLRVPDGNAARFRAAVLDATRGQALLSEA